MENDKEVSDQPRPSDFAFIPQPGDLAELRRLEESMDGQSLALKVGDGDARGLPPLVEAALVRILAFLSANRAVTIQAHDQLLTTQEAADILKVSRPFVVGLLDRGDLQSGPSAGTHRRVYLKEVVDFQRRLGKTTPRPAPAHSEYEATVVDAPSVAVDAPVTRYMTMEAGD